MININRSVNLKLERRSYVTSFQQYKFKHFIRPNLTKIWLMGQNFKKPTNGAFCILFIFIIIRNIYT